MHINQAHQNVEIIEHVNVKWRLVTWHYKCALLATSMTSTARLNIKLCVRGGACLCEEARRE